MSNQQGRGISPEIEQMIKDEAKKYYRHDCIVHASKSYIKGATKWAKENKSFYEWWATIFNFNDGDFYYKDDKEGDEPLSYDELLTLFYKK